MKYLVIVKKPIHVVLNSKEKKWIEKGSTFITDLCLRIIHKNLAPDGIEKRDILFLMRKGNLSHGYYFHKVEFLKLLKNERIALFKMEEE